MPGVVRIQGALPQGCPTGTTTLADGMCMSFISSEDSNGCGIHDVVATPAGQVSSTSVSGARLDSTLGSQVNQRHDNHSRAKSRGTGKSGSDPEHRPISPIVKGMKRVLIVGTAL